MSRESGRKGPTLRPFLPDPKAENPFLSPEEGKKPDLYFIFYRNWSIIPVYVYTNTPFFPFSEGQIY